MSSNSLNVDQRIVQMEFDNAQFEQGVGTSLKSLDKLKNSLDFAGQKNSIDGLSKSMKSFSASPLVASLSAARGGFSALEVAGITVISNLTTRITAMGERLVSAVTVDPVKSGWVEYEQKMDSIKTILNSAKDKNGAAVSLEQVKKKIEELNVYADKTIYSFSDMTKNIGKFTNAGVDLDTATAAIQGVANAAAAAGADSNAASRAMYNFAQSLSVGYMQRIDWKSIENANMATVEFKDELLKTAVAMGTVAKDSNGMYYSLTAGEKKATQATTAAAMFTEKLKDKWLTNDVLIQTLNNYSNTETEIGKKAQEAATKVFTLSKMFDTLKEAMQSGWSATWEKIVGDYDQAGKLFTGINNFLSDIINKSSDKRVKFLDELLNQKKAINKEDWELFKVGKDKKELDSYRKIIKQVARDHGIQIDKIVKKNKTFGESLKEGWFTDDIFNEASVKIREMSTKMAEEASKSTKGNKKATASFKEMTASIGQTTNSLNKLGEATDKSGREMLIDSFKAIFEQVSRVYENIQRAYDSVFPKSTASQLYEFIQRIRDYTQNFEISINTIYRVRDAFKGFFSIIKLVVNIGKTGIRLFLGIIKRLKPVGKMILDIASGLGRMADSFRKNYEKGGKFKEIVDVTLESMDKLFQKIKELTQGKSITKDNWLAFTDDLDPKDVELYEKVIKRIAREHGVNVDAMIEKNGNFADSLKEDWFTKDIFNEVNYYLDNISAKKRKGPAIYTKDEVKSLKTLRKSLNDTESDWSKLGETAGKTGTEIVLGFAEKAFKPFEKVFDVIIDNIPKVVSGIGIVASFLGGRILRTAKIIWRIAKYIYTAITGISEETKTNIKTNLGKVKDFLKKIYDSGKKIVSGFINKMKDQLPNIKDNFKKIWEHVKKLKDALKKAFNSVKDFVKKAGEMIEIKKVVKAIAGFFTALAGLTFGAVIFVIGAITDFFKYVSSNKTVNKVFSAIGDALIKMFQGLEKVAGKVKTFVTELFKLEGVKTAMGNIKEFFASIGEFVFDKTSSGFNTIGDVFKSIGDKLPSMETVLNTINGLLDGTVSKFQTIKDIFSKGIEVITGVFKPKVDTEDLDEVEDNANDQKKSLEKSGNTLKTALGNFTKDIENGLDNLSSAKILKTGALLGLVYIVWQIGALVKNFKNIFKNVANLTSLSARNPIAKFVTGLTGALSAWRKKTDAEIVLTMAKAIGILAISLVAITKVADSKNIDKVVGIIFWLTIAMAILVRSIGSALNSSSGIDQSVRALTDNLTLIGVQIKLMVAKALKLASVGSVLLLAAAGVAILTGAFGVLYKTFTQENVDWGMVILSMVSVAALLGMLSAVVYGMTKMNGNVPKGAAVTILAFAVGVNMIAGTLSKLANVEGSLKRGIVGLVVIVASLTLSLIALKKWAATSGTDALLDIAAALVVFGVAIRIVAGAVIKIAESAADGNNVYTALGAVVTIIIALGGVMGLLGTFAGNNAVSMIQIAVSMVIFAGAIALLVRSLEPLAELDPPQFKQLAIGFIALAGAMVILGLIGTALPGLAIVSAFLASLGIMAAGVGVGVFLIVKALDMLGPALEKFVTGLANAGQKLVDNAPIITAGLAALIGIICTAMLAKTALLEKTAFSMLLGLLSGIEGALMAFLPKGKILMVAGIIVLVAAVLGALDKIMPGAVDKILGLIVKGLNALASAIVNRSHGLVGAIANIMKAILFLFWEIVSQLMESISEFLSKIGLGHVMEKNMKENREFIDKMKSDLISEFANDQEMEDQANLNDKAKQHLIESATVPGPVSTPGNNINELQSEKNYVRQTQDQTTDDKTVEESYQDGYDKGQAEAKGKSDGLIAGFKSVDGDAISSIWNKLTGAVDDKGMIDKASLMGMDFSKELGNNIDFSGVLDKGYTASEALNMILGGPAGAEAGTGYSTELAENMDGTEAVKKAEDIQKDIENVEAETSTNKDKTEKITTKQDVTLTATVNTKSADKSMVDAAKGMMAKYGDAIKKQKEPIKKKVENVMQGAAHAAGSEKIKADFHESGSNAIQGLIDGINAKLPTLRAKALEAARLIKKTITSKPALDENSPSKAMFRIGDYAMVGLVNGFGNRMDALESSALDAAHSISDGTSYVLARTSAMLSDGIDSTPTIRPVLDLSDVEAGARSINGMLGGRTLSVGSINASRLATSMNARQNGSDPLISAINDLGRSLSAQPSNVYNLNGITYDDGSNIATAIGMLAHAAVVEGRA